MAFKSQPKPKATHAPAAPGASPYDTSKHPHAGKGPGGGRFTSTGAHTPASSRKASSPSRTASNVKGAVKLRTGLSDDALLDPARRAAAIAHMKAMGMREGRLVAFSNRYGDGAGGYDFSQLRAAATDLRHAGIAVRIVASGPPAYDRSGDQTLAAQSPAAFASYVGKMAAELKGLVTSYSMWNEPNHVAFAINRDPVAYRKLSNAGYAAVKKADPRAKVIAGEVAAGPIGWLRKALPGLKADGIAVHPYMGPSDPRAKPSAAYRGKMSMVNLGEIRKLVGPKMALLVTEFGFPPSVGDARRARLLKQAAEQCRRYNVSSLLLYQLESDPSRGWDTGLLAPGGGGTASSAAVAAIARAH